MGQFLNPYPGAGLIKEQDFEAAGMLCLDQLYKDRARTYMLDPIFIYTLEFLTHTLVLLQVTVFKYKNN